jgi:hippurate hydrolase
MLSEARKIEETIRDWRRDIHRHPELGFQEFRTAELAVRLAGEERRRANWCYRRTGGGAAGGGTEGGYGCASHSRGE